MYYGNTRDLTFSHSPATKVCLSSQNNSAVQSQKAVLFYFTSEQTLDFQDNCDPYTFNSLDLFHDTICVQAHLNVYYSGCQMLAALAQNFTIIRTTTSF